MIKLCYKEYDYKMSLGAIKSFKESTGMDLWCTLISFIECYLDTQKDPLVSRMRALYSIVDFEVASIAFHSLIKSGEKSKNTPLAEIQDAMFRVGWTPSDREDDMSEPWPFVMVNAAFEIDSEFKSLGKKKAGISE